MDSAGFEHNFQSLRVVDLLEERYPRYDGLNLTFETREGILKHCSRRHATELESAEPGGVGRRFIERTQPSLEAQVCNLADEIAYNAHDIDDGVRSGLLDDEQLLELPPFARCHRESIEAFPGLIGRRLLFEAIRRLLSSQVYDVIDASEKMLVKHQPLDCERARQCPPLIVFGQRMASEVAQIKSFLRERLYRHPQVVESTEGAKRVVRELFHAYLQDPSLLPPQHAAREPLLQTTADYIAGMTDRFAMREHARLTGTPASTNY